MGHGSDKHLEFSEELVRLGFQDWEIDKLIRELSEYELYKLIKRVEAELEERKNKQDEGNTTE